MFHLTTHLCGSFGSRRRVKKVRIFRAWFSQFRLFFLPSVKNCDKSQRSSCWLEWILLCVSSSPLSLAVVRMKGGTSFAGFPSIYVKDVRRIFEQGCLILMQAHRIAPTAKWFYGAALHTRTLRMQALFMVY